MIIVLRVNSSENVKMEMTLSNSEISMCKMSIL